MLGRLTLDGEKSCRKVRSCGWSKLSEGEIRAYDRYGPNEKVEGKEPKDIRKVGPLGFLMGHGIPVSYIISNPKIRVLTM